MSPYLLNPFTGELDAVDRIGIGDTVISGTPDSVLYIGDDGKLAETNPGFTFDSPEFKIDANTTVTALRKVVYDGV